MICKNIGNNLFTTSSQAINVSYNRNKYIEYDAITCIADIEQNIVETRNPENNKSHRGVYTSTVLYSCIECVHFARKWVSYEYEHMF